ncbi:TIGR03619 family F420-dependent LLM class oxidoreductase [Nocardia gipuzkoensis]
MAVAAERHGFDGFSLSEHPAPGARWLGAGGHQTLDPFVALAFAAAATERLRLITYLTVAPYRNPMLLAKSAAILDKLSGGRMILGLGAGYQKSEFHALGVDFDERNALVDEALAVLPLHWSGEPFSYTGRHFGARDVVARPRPVQRPIPIWVDGNSRLSRRRVTEHAQGWIPMTGGAELSATARPPNWGRWRISPARSPRSGPAPRRPGERGTSTSCTPTTRLASPLPPPTPSAIGPRWRNWPRPEWIGSWCPVARATVGPRSISSPRSARRRDLGIGRVVQLATGGLGQSRAAAAAARRRLSPLTPGPPESERAGRRR